MRYGKARRALRGLSILGVGSALLLGVSAAPAAADGNEFEDTFSVTFIDVNPCTGLPHEITINGVVHVSEGDDGVEIKEDRTGTTDSGYVLGGGEVNAHLNTDGVPLEVELRDEWHRPDGSSFLAMSRLVIDPETEEVLIDEFSLTCADD